MKKATRYERQIYEPCNIKLVNIGKYGRATCTNLPDNKQEVIDSINENTHTRDGEPFSRGAGDEYILNNPNCVLRYYLDGKLVRTIR